MKVKLGLCWTALTVLALASGQAAWAGATPENKQEAAAAVDRGTGALAQYATPQEYARATGKSVEARGEAPALAELVKAGKLPPLKQRLPEEPAVISPLDSVGRYGGDLRVASLGPTMNFDSAPVRYQHLFKVAPDLHTIIPNVAKGWDLSDDLTTLTVHLRKGLKWSDGAPVTADDARFWFEDIISDKRVTAVMPASFAPGGQPMQFRKIDDTAFELKFAVPYVGIINNVALYGDADMLVPRHYLSKYHLKYNPDADKLARSEGFDSWSQALLAHNLQGRSMRDVNKPTLEPWMLKEITTTRHVFERNPYFWKIDTAGNQLPYLDREIVVFAENAEIINLKIIAGEIDFSSRNLALASYPIYKQNEAAGKYRTILADQPLGSNFGLGFNPTHKDPVLRALFNDLRFKQAMSLAINRDEINQSFFFGNGTPRQATAPPNTTFYEEWMGKHFVEYDVARANKLLDEVGLKWDGDRKYRLRPDGKTLAVTVNTTPVGVAPEAKILELIKSYWEAVGVKTDFQVLARNLFNQRGLANEHDVAAFQFGGNGNELAMFTNRAFLYRPPWGVLVVGVPWQTWYDTKGQQGEEPPAVVKRLFQAIDEWTITRPGSEDYKRLGREILKIHGENLFYIGTIGLVPSPTTIAVDLKNTPREGATMIVTYEFGSPHMAEQWYR